MRELRLGDIIDDFCVKCRRLTNHAIVSLVGQAAAKVRCRTCYSDHDYRNEQAPPSKKDLKKAALFNQVLAGVAPIPDPGVADAVAEFPAVLPAEVSTELSAEVSAEVSAETAAPQASAPVKKTRKKS